MITQSDTYNSAPAHESNFKNTNFNYEMLQNDKKKYTIYNPNPATIQ